MSKILNRWRRHQPVLNRCLFIEGIGRVHAIGNSDRLEVAVMDHGDVLRQLDLGYIAHDILTGVKTGKIRWAVRFAEKAA